MNEQSSAGQAPGTDGQARHGYRNEVNWEGGSGRQPYSNQGRRETPGPDAGEPEAEGNRRERSGRTQEHLEQVKRKP